MQVPGSNTSSSQTFPKKLPESPSPAKTHLTCRADQLYLRNKITLVTKLATIPECLTATNRLLEQVLYLVDTLSKTKFRPEVPLAKGVR